MIKLTEIVHEVGAIGSPVSLRQVLRTHNVHSVRELVASLHRSEAFCEFKDPPGSIGVAPKAYGLMNGYPRKSKLAWRASGGVNGVPNMASIVGLAFAKWSAAAPSLSFTNPDSGDVDIAVGGQDLGTTGIGFMRE